ncbi:isochorismate-pyruvate lyase [Pseudomonas sp. TKO26]|nr:isochorismate-pyruvate lyase [Pseudomonas sp. TKO30]PYY91350.1 isochorismate-pyruvate lyase [Pseudomonas sp. TKO29]PYY94005.1 isochorismate-pyruvate lyase [Pseudomonas sp. TKO26]PYZ00719.1 isochorismate-pyruvate lyase [Pseudomonas sp. TKO14]
MAVLAFDPMNLSLVDLYMKTPEQCSGLDDVRCGIDAMDRQIIQALGQRLAYVKAAAQFKPTEDSIAAPERVAAMLPQRRQWAEQAGLDPMFVVPLFAQIIHWNIAQQVRHWRLQHGLEQGAGDE